MSGFDAERKSTDAAPLYDVSSEEESPEQNIREDILEAGAESEDEVTAIQQLLIEHCQKKPLDNIRELELSLVKNLTQKEIDRTIRRVRKAKERRY